MRTTVEIPDQQRAKLLELAAMRGEKGFSHLVQEAIERYLRELEKRESRRSKALATLGSLDDDSAEFLERAVREIRATWR